MATIHDVTRDAYTEALTSARAASELVASMTSPAWEVPYPDSYGITYRLTADKRSGYYVTGDGYWGGLFSLTPGRGDALVADAIAHGALTLDCFDGYLPTLYARHGFVETDRDANWTPGGPDVVYMAREV